MPKKFNNALVSVSDKTGLKNLLKPLSQQGLRIVSTGGTARFLQKAGIEVIDLKSQTGFKEVLGGRVKSLHPRIYMPLLARNNLEDQDLLTQQGLMAFDLLICNLYPFMHKQKERSAHLEEWIDVGGASLLRAGAKNFEQVTVLSDPADYPLIQTGKVPDLSTRKKLAHKAFALLAKDNQHIAHWLNPIENTKQAKPPTPHKPPPWIPALKQGGTPLNNSPCLNKPLSGQDLSGENLNGQTLSYGENPCQKAYWVQTSPRGLHKAQQVQGKVLSYNNIADLNSAVSALQEFSQPCSVAIKHQNPCGLACHKDIHQALSLSLKADPVSVFGAIVALNREVGEKSALKLCSLFLEGVIAPSYTKGALQMLQLKKKNLRVLKWPQLEDPLIDPLTGQEGGINSPLIRSVQGGLLIQDRLKLKLEQWQYIGPNKPSPAMQADLLLAWKVCAHLKSNAIAIVGGGQTLGLGMGEVNRVSAVKMAIKRWKRFHPQVTQVVMASDGFFPFADSVALAGQEGIKWVVQPGGSIRDKEVFQKAKSLSVNMVLTGQRCFAH